MTVNIEAALEEGLAVVDADQLALVRRARLLKARQAEIEAELKTIRETFHKNLAEAGLRGLLYRGKKVVQVISKTSRGVDRKLLADRFPEVLDVVTTVTPYDEVRIS